MSSKIEDASFAAAQASRCLRLARQCSDAEIARRLGELARAFADYARRKGAGPVPEILARCVRVESRARR